MDVLARVDLRFPQSLPEFQRVFPDDAACAAYLEKARWAGGFACPWCSVAGEPFRFGARPGVLRCRACRKDVGLMAGTVMERSHTPVNRRPKGTPYRRAIGTPSWGSGLQ